MKEIVSAETALLIIDENKTDLFINSGVRTFPYGYKSVANHYFTHTPPTESEIEEAINYIEDHIMPVVKDIENLNLQLLSIDEKAFELKRYIDPDSHILSIRDVECIFSRLASIITGRPVSSDILPALDNEFSAYLLILREMMHHLKFENLKPIRLDSREYI